MQEVTAYTEVPVATMISESVSVADSPSPSVSWQHRGISLGTLEAPFAELCRDWLRPLIVALSLLACAVFEHVTHWTAYVVMAAGATICSRQIFTPLRASAPRPLLMLLQWTMVAALLLISGDMLGLTGLLPDRLVLSWLVTATAGLLLLEFLSPLRRSTSARPHRYIVVGANDIGMEFHRREARSNRASVFLGYFDFREHGRALTEIRQQISGQCRDLASFVQSHSVMSIYIALPMSNAPRIEKLVTALRDTTASVYFLPNFFAFDLVQARCVESNGMAMLSICDTPFHGVNALKKRAFDLVVGSLLLIATSPLMLLTALAVKLGSRGPVLFKQRRYGLHGEKILVYKFRSMSVCEDGEVVVQAQRHDPRVTRVGSWIRKASLDELPQLINVLQGKMSLVGPRPHAVAHNEVYRTLISGYMLRHKVRPGMTGWAQVNGLRGEIGGVEQLRQRVNHDLEYLRQWSVSFDLRILLRTLMLMFRPGNAF